MAVVLAGLGGVVFAGWPGGHSAPAGAVSPPNGYSLRFFDDFSGRYLNGSNWNTYITSNQAQGYAWNGNEHGGSSPANATQFDDAEYDLASQLQVGRGLRITAQSSPIKGWLGDVPRQYPWRSGVVCTYGKFEFTGGYLDVIAKVPTAPGMWPGIFLLPGRLAGRSGDNYEIDVLEGGYTSAAAASWNDRWTLHTPAGSRGSTTDVGQNLANGYHHYGLQWSPGRFVRWFFDGRLIGQITKAMMPIPDEPMELVIDLQVANQSTASFHTITGASTPPQNVMSVRSVSIYEPTRSSVGGTPRPGAYWASRS